MRIPCERSESSPILHLIAMVLQLHAQLVPFTRFPFMSGQIFDISFYCASPARRISTPGENIQNPNAAGPAALGFGIFSSAAPAQRISTPTENIPQIGAPQALRR